MLTVIIDAQREARRLPPLLAQLTAGAVEGLVREVLLVAPSALVADLCEETGAEPVGSLDEAARRARSDRLLLLPATFRFREGWIEALVRHLSDGGGTARMRGQGRWPTPGGLLVERRQALGRADLDRLRGDLRLLLWRRLG